MTLEREVATTIRALETKGFYAECPCCGEPILLKEAGLFYLGEFTQEAEELYKRRLAQIKEHEDELQKKRKRIDQTSQVGAKAVNIGFVLERIAPALKDFRFERNDCRSLFDPIDYVIFEGLSKKFAVDRIVFVDIKTGGARLKPTQREIRSLVERKRVVWDVYATEA
jgi:predicted Holliday junction resolvase-like endonuclease